MYIQKEFLISGIAFYIEILSQVLCSFRIWKRTLMESLDVTIKVDLYFKLLQYFAFSFSCILAAVTC